MKAYRASILYFSAQADSSLAHPQAVLETDGLLVVGPNAQGRQVVQAVGAYAALAPRFLNVPTEHFPGRIIAPGFVDLHIHYPQIDVIGSPAEGLLPWLDNYTFPQETRFAKPDHSAAAAEFFIAELLRNGVTTALTFASSHPESVIQLRVAPNEWQMRAATVLEVDKIHDLALLRFDGPAMAALHVRDSNAVQEGQAVAFMGFPIGGALGFSPVTHRGMISSITAAALPTPSAQQLNEKTIRSLRGGNSFNIFQLDGTAYPGNSGGPLFDPDTADVLGVVNMVFIKGTKESALSSPSGISYAIPSGFILQLLQRSLVH